MNRDDERFRPYVPDPNWLAVPDEDDLPHFGLLLGAVLVLALILRLYRLDYQSLWVDEIMTYRQIRPDAGLHFGHQILDAIQGPLFQAVLWPLVRWQDSAFWMRLPSALAGAMTVPLLGLCAARLAGRRAGLLAALLLAVNPFHVWYSQEARGYALLLLLTVITGMFALDLMGKDRRWSKVLLLGLAGGLAMLANMSAAFFWFALGLTFLMLQVRDDRGALIRRCAALGLGLAVAAPWLLRASGVWAVDRILPGAPLGDALRGASTFTPLAIPYTLYSFFAGFSLGPSLADLHVLSGSVILERWGVLLLVLAVAVAVPLVGSLGWTVRRRPFLLLWVAVPFAVLAVLALRNIKPWNPRYAATALPWLVLMVAVGLSRLPRRLGSVALGVLLACSLWSLGGYFWQDGYMREDVRSAAEFVSGEVDSGDVVLAPVVTAVVEHYYRGSAPLLQTYGLGLLDQAAAGSFMDQWLPGASRVWYIRSRAWDFDPRGLLQQEMARRGTLRRVYRGAGVEVYLFTLRPGSALR